MRGLLLLLGLRLLAADLIQVQVVSRAGAHKWHFPSKQWRQESAALLPAGFVGMEELGQVLKARYIGLAASMPLSNVSDIYQFGDALIRTMAREQTVQSADAITYGVWSPVGRAVRGAPLTGGHQAVPVFTISPAMDYLLSAYRACPMVDFVVDTFMNGSDYQKKENSTLGIRTQLGTLLNMSSELIMMPQLYDRVVLATLYGDMPSAGEILPALSPEQMVALEDMANFVEALQIKMSSALNMTSPVPKGDKKGRGRRLNPVGAAFIGLFAGILLAVLMAVVGPKVGQIWANRRDGGAYQPRGEEMDGGGGGIEAQGGGTGGIQGRSFEGGREGGREGGSRLPVLHSPGRRRKDGVLDVGSEKAEREDAPKRK
ncbi:hypothetical protein NSK_005817 [Nannochloropsis salina CCMP1776]|uniref:Acid phosphatase n=1 Tax=Nannochloropsis salina CCMP1776 TaxID=1027361 RepID=A0A4D9CW95_9STRA|nr:hypothetical protein NSK_005817 [Nannochloropsis salina CCMP1776]|eukprot:TFJ82864.1 hypothetical protein NSK_005817 [Nannochloropsis salina CCMP1776]